MNKRPQVLQQKQLVCKSDEWPNRTTSFTAWSLKNLNSLYPHPLSKPRVKHSLLSCQLHKQGTGLNVPTWKLTDKILPWTQVNLHWFFKTMIQTHSIWTTAKWECWCCLLSTGPGCSRLSTFLAPHCINTSDVCTTFGPRDKSFSFIKAKRPQYTLNGIR